MGDEDVADLGGDLAGAVGDIRVAISERGFVLFRGGVVSAHVPEDIPPKVTDSAIEVNDRAILLISHVVVLADAVFGAPELASTSGRS